MHRIFRVKAYEAEHGPHFNEEHARKAVSKMENEDGTRGPHWSIEETTTLANQYGISLGNRFNRYDWFVALNMVYSDYYKVIISMTNSNSTKHFVELAKAWINDKDIDEGKMWYYYIYVMCDKIRQAEMECYEEEVEKRDKYEDDDDDEFERIGLFRRGGRRGGMMRGGRRVYSTSRARDYEDDYERMLGRRRLNTISGIPVLKTTGVVATSTEVRYDVNYQEYRSLPNEGLFFLDVRQSSAEASASLPVGLSDGNSENNNQSMLRNALQEDVQAGDLQLNFRYLIYYNKCNNVY
uniref:DUF7841 domain-containing protein n=1 Tax=CrAss-like virus sp. ctRQZ5 TaxID=2826824 RepID=A0A8S5LXP6_9CAUD|nr:MAG TPA: hypothetical protein [CrAss-like virus sp. ctRQZ5]